MKSASRIRLQRNYFWTLAELYEQAAEGLPEGEERDVAWQMAHEMALYVGAMDWVLGEDFEDPRPIEETDFED